METKNCQQCRKSFVIEAEDFDFYTKMGVPAPTFCPECRLIRRLTFRNDRTMYKRTCELCKKDVISIYQPEGGTKIVCQKCWWSDDFDATKYGKDYDFSRPFFDQYKELMGEVPFMANFVVDESRMVNSPYNNMVLDLRNCYLMFNSDFNEDCSYGCEVEKSKNCFDTVLIDKSEMCYECVNLQNCYRAFHSVDCESSSDIWFCKDCNGCTDCFGCVNLRKKSFCIFNKPMGTKEAYMEKLKEFNLSSRKGIKRMKRKTNEFWQTGITKYMHEKQNDGVEGDYIYKSKDVRKSWIIHEGRNLKYCQYLVASNSKDCYDYTQFGFNTELQYEVLQGGNGGSRVSFSWFSASENMNLDYCIQMMTSKYMFGCIGLRKKEYYILNKQYTEEEFNVLREKIIEQMKNMPYKDKIGLIYKYGEFFPSELSPFAYNETTAQEFFPLNERIAVEKGYEWYKRESRNYNPTILTEEIPDTIAQVEDSVTSEIVECWNNGDENKNCTTAFKITPDELGFYKRFNLPLPSKCPNCRHSERMKLRNLPIFRKGKCGHEGCENEILTAYPETTPNLYCKDHYLQTVV